MLRLVERLSDPVSYVFEWTKENLPTIATLSLGSFGALGVYRIYSNRVYCVICNKLKARRPLRESYSRRDISKDKDENGFPFMHNDDYIKKLRNFIDNKDYQSAMLLVHGKQGIK